MGQSMFATHEVVPDDVKASIKPIDYTPCPDDKRQVDAELCEDCGSYFGWFCSSANCDWCGRQLCTRCCPTRYLLKDQPGCAACTQKAFRMRRSEMLSAHLSQRSAAS